LFRYRRAGTEKGRWSNLAPFVEEESGADASDYDLHGPRDGRAAFSRVREHHLVEARGARGTGQDGAGAR
jgi:hypothetical protein